MTDNKIYTHVPGAPYQVGDWVTVIATEHPDDEHLVGLDGVVTHLDYSCGCGQTYPNDPMIGVKLDNGKEWEFWKEELSPRVDLGG
jgi:hypothetical protein